MTNILLILGIIATLAASLWLAFEDRAVLAPPLVIVLAGLVRTLVRRSGRRGITPAELAPPPHDDRQL